MEKKNNFLFADKITENRTAFFKRLSEISGNLNIPVNWMMLVFYIETGASKTGVIDHRAYNTKTKATGLIQFMPATAKSLGTSVEALKEMINVEQLDYVQKYLKPYASKIKSYTDCYLAVLFPVAIGKPSSWVLETRNLPADKVADYNPLFDTNKDGKITVGEIEEKLKLFIPKDFAL